LPYMIDPPSPFASKTEWQQFLNEMLRLRQEDPDVSCAVKMAEEALQNLESTRA
jgi:hypothetical protein